MRQLVILGAGTAGTMAANKLRPRLPREEWSITVVDRDDQHHFQPGYLFLPFGGYRRRQLLRDRRQLLTVGVDLVLDEIVRVEADHNLVVLKEGGALAYDYLVIATGTTLRPDQTPGMLGAEWRRSVFDFYTLDGAEALAAALRRLGRGRLVMHVAEMPIKCPIAPLEFAFLADDWLRKHGLRDRVEMAYVSPLDAAFTQPVAARLLRGMLEDRKIAFEPDFMVERIDNEHKQLVSFDGREASFDLLVTVPVNRGAEFVAVSGLGDELNYVRVDKRTHLSEEYDNVFALGDASNLPTSKAGSVAHFAVDVFVGNFLQHLRGEPMTGWFDGHANCFVETGGDKALLIDFNYDSEPLPGTYPFPQIGPSSLLEETRLNHAGKLAFRRVYWNLLLPGRPVPRPAQMSMAGKRPDQPKKDE